MDDSGFSEAVGAIYDTVLDESNWPSALKLICEHVGGSHALLFHQDRALRSGDFLHSWNADPHWTKLYFEKYVGLNPAMPYTILMDVGTVTSLSRVVDMEEFRASVFYREWAKPQGYLDVCVAMLEKSGSAMGMIGVNRLESDGLVEDENVRRMEALTPHIRRAVKLGRQFASLEANAAIFADVVMALSDAVFVLNDQGRLLFANESGRTMLDQGQPFTLNAGLLTPNDQNAASAMRLTLRSLAKSQIARDDFCKDVVFAEETGEKLLGQFLPLFHGNRRGNGFTDAVAALFVRRVGPLQKPPLEALALLYGLTPRELQIYVGIIQFGSVPDVAEVFGLAPSTVRTHLQSVFDKTGTRRQADLVALAASLTGGPKPP